MPEGLSASEVGKEIAEHREHTAAEHAVSEHAQRDRWVAIVEAVLLSVVALLAAWSGYSAAKWGTESSLSLAKASSTRSKASLALIQPRRSARSTRCRSTRPKPPTPPKTSSSSAWPSTAFAPGLSPGLRGVDRAPPAEEPARTARPVLHAAIPDPTRGRRAGTHRFGRRAISRKARQPRARRTSTCGSPSSGRRPVSGRHRQPLPGTRGALWAGRRGRRAARGLNSATAWPSRAALLNSRPVKAGRNRPEVDGRSPRRIVKTQTLGPWRSGIPQCRKRGRGCPCGSAALAATPAVPRVVAPRCATCAGSSATASPHNAPG